MTYYDYLLLRLLAGPIICLRTFCLHEGLHYASMHIIVYRAAQNGHVAILRQDDCQGRPLHCTITTKGISYATDNQSNRYRTLDGLRALLHSAHFDAPAGIGDW